MDGYLWYVAGSVTMLIIAGVVSLIKRMIKNAKGETTMVKKHDKQICAIEERLKESREMDVLMLKFLMAIGDGLVELKVNGKVKSTFNELKEQIINKVGE